MIRELLLIAPLLAFIALVGFSERTRRRAAPIIVKIRAALERRHVSQAAYDSQQNPGCMEGTREEILDQIKHWARKPDGPKIFWISGMVGTGKTSIATTVCKRASTDTEIMLGGTFFCSRSTGDPRRRDIRCVIPTLAQLLAQKSDSFLLALVEKFDADIADKNIEVQVERLLRVPLQALKGTRVPILFVIDELDVCGVESATALLDDVASRKAVTSMLKALFSLTESKLGLPIKFLVTARPEPQIRDALKSYREVTQIMQLHAVNQEVVKEDIRVYITRTLCSELSDNVQLPDGITNSDVEKLVQLSDGLFIIAATALRHTFDLGADAAVMKFRQLLGASRNSFYASIAVPLEEMYAVVIANAARADGPAAMELSALQQLLTPLISAPTMLSITALGNRLNLKAYDVRYRLSRLHSVVYVPDGDEVSGLRTVHGSFDDFLLNRASDRIRDPWSLGHDTSTSGSKSSIINRTSDHIAGGSLTTNDPVIDANSDRAIDIIRRARLKNEVVEFVTTSLGDRFVPDAADDAQPSSAGCMPDTRTHVLSKLVAWAISDLQRIYWLVGMAGTGKSSIALTMCRMLRDEPAVLFGGGFFCSSSAGSNAQTDARCIMPTLARLLAGVSPEFATALAVELAKGDRIAFKPIRDQIGPLLRQPLSAFGQMSRPVVFVIDALDELEDESELAELLKLIADLQSDVSVKFILTSRPEMHIRHTPITNPERNTIFKLHELDSVEVQQDIRRYIDGTFASVAKESTWYTAADVDALVNLSNGLFIFAATTLKYVLDGYGDEGRRDRLLKMTSAVAQSAAFTASLDNTYELVVTQAFRSDTIDTEEPHGLDSILACILTSHSALSVQTLADLIRLKPSLLRHSLQRLQAVIHVPEDDNAPGLRGIHVSFGDYLLDRAPSHIRIARSLGHETLARGCLYVMANQLHFNVSHSRSSYEANPTNRPDSVTLALEYACLHWVDHVTASSHAIDFDDEISAVFRPRFLAWLQVMSLLRQVGHAAIMLLNVAATVSNPTLAQFLRDARSFVASSRGAIERSAPHIYLSALPFANKSSLVYKGFSPHYNGLIIVNTLGVGLHGGTIAITLSGHEGAVRSVAYSGDGQLLASGSQDGTVRIWDTQTGKETLCPLCSGDGPVLLVDFARNNKRVAFATQAGAVCIWNVTSRQASNRRLSGNSGSVTAVAFSPDCSRLASASRDRTACLWNPETGEQLAVLNGHTDTVTDVTFSPDGLFLALISSDRTIRQWDSATGRAAWEPLEDTGLAGVDTSPDGDMITGDARTGQASVPPLFGHTSRILFVSISPDGHLIASASQDRTLRLWDTQSGASVGEPMRGHAKYVLAVTFSHDGRWLASASWDKTVRMWHVATQQALAVGPLRCHSGANTVAFSPDDELVAAADDGGRIYLWRTDTGDQVHGPVYASDEKVWSLVFSPDATRIVFGGEDNAACILDIKTGQRILVLEGHTRYVQSVAWSPDGRVLGTGSDDATVRLWDAVTGAPLATLHGHAKAVRSVVFTPDRTFIVSDS